MTIDPIEKAIGRFGRYQVWILFLITIGRLPTEFQLINVVFLVPDVEYECLDDLSVNATNVCPCLNPEYDNSTIVSSVTTTWNLICEHKSWASMAQSILQVGVLAGSLIYGYVSDRYGRKTAIVLSFTLEAITIVASAAVTNFWLFMLFRFLIGTGVGGTMLCCFVLLIELSGKSFRAYCTGLNEIAYVVGYVLLPVFAYFIRDWRYLQLSTSIPWLFTFVYYWLIPESPRWLITVGKKQQAIDVLTNIAAKNGMPTDNIEETVNEMEIATKNEMAQTHGTYADLFKTPKVRAYTFIMAAVWLCCSHTFFGVNQYIGRLQGNIYLNVLLSAACTAPGLILCIILTVKLKRKLSVIISFVIATVALLIMSMTPLDYKNVILSLAIIGQVGVYNAFVQIYLYASELFPTVVRNSALGFASTFARIGAFIAPFIVNIGEQWISILVFGSLSLVAAILCSFLPETKGVVLMNTIEQTEHIPENDNESKKRLNDGVSKF